MTDQVTGRQDESEAPTCGLVEAEQRAAEAWRRLEASGSSFGNHPLSHLIDASETDTAPS